MEVYELSDEELKQNAELALEWIKSNKSFELEYKDDGDWFYSRWPFSSALPYRKLKIKHNNSQ